MDKLLNVRELAERSGISQGTANQWLKDVAGELGRVHGLAGVWTEPAKGEETIFRQKLTEF